MLPRIRVEQYVNSQRLTEEFTVSDAVLIIALRVADAVEARLSLHERTCARAQAFRLQNIPADDVTTCVGSSAACKLSP